MNSSNSVRNRCGSDGPMDVTVIDWVEPIEGVYVADYEHEFKFESLKGGTGDKIEMTKYQKGNSHLERLSRGA